MLALLLGLVSSSAFILFDKKVTEEHGKVGEPVHVVYRIFNLGDGPADNLHIDDSGIPLEQWEFPKSANNLRWTVLEPGRNVTYVFSAKPLTAGNLRMGASRLRYLSEGQKRIALSSQLFWFEARSTRSIGAKANLLGYSLVVGVAFLSIFVPFIFWILTRRKPVAKISKGAARSSAKEKTN
jgi:hypothetical protein